MTNSNAFTGSIPANYHRYLGPFLFEGYADDLAARVPAAAGIRVLEIACGTGIVTERLAARLAGRGTLVASDLNEAMFAEARRRNVQGGHVTWRQADGTNLPFPDASFDAVVCQFGLMFFPDKAAGVREAFRVLTPGGRFCFNVWDAMARNPVQRITHETVAGFFPDDPPQFYIVPCSLGDRAPILAWLDHAGFASITVETVAGLAPPLAAGDAVRGLIDGNPICLEILERRADALPAIKAALAARLAAELGDPIRGPLRAHVFCAHKP